MLIKIWKERNKILEGVKNNVFKKEHVEQVARHRNAICNECDFIDLTGTNCAVPGTQPCCSECGCSLKLKTRSLSSSCPKGYWDAVVTQAEEDIINNSINSNNQ